MAVTHADIAAKEGQASSGTYTPKVAHLDHIRELEASGIARATWEAAGVYTEFDARKITDLLGWRFAAKKLGHVLVFPYFGADGKPTGYVRLKPSTPRTERDQKGKIKTVKYEAPKDKPPQAYLLPPVMDVCRSGEPVPLLITEGEKKALCTYQHGFPTIGLSGVWSWRSKAQGWTLLPELAAITWAGRVVYIVFDSDRTINEDVRTAEGYLAAELASRGATVFIVCLPAGPNGAKTGLDDYFVRGATLDDLQKLLASAIVPTQPNRPKKRGNRVVIRIDTDEHRVNDEAVAALSADPDLYARGGQLVRVVIDDAATAVHVAYPPGPRIAPVSTATLRERLTVVAEYDESRGEGENGLPVYVPTSPPDWSVKAIADRGTWSGIRRLVATIDYPALMPDGTVLTTPGYHPATGILYAPRGTAQDLELPESPTRDDARRAAAELLDVVSEFPFAAAHHRAAWVAALLTPLARYAFAGCAPMFLADGNVPGCGKGLLVDVVSLIVRGLPLAITTLPETGEELRKRITAVLVRGCPMVLFDNLTRLGGAELDALLTSPTWTDRLLGESKMVEDLPVLTTWLGTGNNVAVIGDTIRRVCPIRLDSPEEQPEGRTGFRRPDLRGWVQTERPRLLSAALTILAGYHSAGRPDQRLPTWGSFEGWSALVRGAAVWAGLPDPAGGREALRDSGGDERLAAVRALLKGWSEIAPAGNGMTAAAAIRAIDLLPESHELHDALLTLAGPKPDKDREDKRSSKLGYVLRQQAGRMIGGRRLTGEAGRTGSKKWLVSTGGAGDVGDEGDVSSYPAYARVRDNTIEINLEIAGTIPSMPSIPCSGTDLDALAALRA